MTLFLQNVAPSRTPAIQAAIDRLAEGGAAERGAVFTRPAVAEFMLDLAGYTIDQDLVQMRLLEPCFGDGEFLLTAISRLLTAFVQQGGDVENAAALSPCVLGVELHRATWARTERKVTALLGAFGVPRAQQDRLLQAWLRQDDFLLTPIEGHFTHVVGNPPYLRQEAVPPILFSAYRARYGTIFDRADLYVPFFERGLDLLEAGGKLCFICSDRWLRNRYGGPLRQKVAAGYHVAAFVDMVDTDAFCKEVTAYPAITLITRDAGHDTRLTLRPDLSPNLLQNLALALRGALPHERVETVPWAVQGAEPWLLDIGPALAVLRDIEARFPRIEEAGCTVGIGVATGADRVYIGQLDTLNVEDDRKLPLAMAADVRSGTLRWSGQGIVNPFDAAGRVVNLDEYPRLRAHFMRHEATIRARSVAQRSSRDWFRTIDKISVGLTATPKLLIPDLSGTPVITYDPGTCYPHHNLYFVTSGTWDLLALKTVLRSKITSLFVGAYSIKMRGGTLRFQAQYLRRLRLPLWAEVPEAMRERLRHLSDSKNLSEVNAATFELFKLSEHAISVLSES